MTPAQFAAARHALGLTQEALAERLGYAGTPQTKRTIISRFETGKRPIPPMAALLLKALLRTKPPAY